MFEMMDWWSTSYPSRAVAALAIFGLMIGCGGSKSDDEKEVIIGGADTTGATGGDTGVAVDTDDNSPDTGGSADSGQTSGDTSTHDTNNDTGPAGISCSAIHQCIVDCSKGFDACKTECTAKGTSAAASTFESFASCMSSNCPGGSVRCTCIHCQQPMKQCGNHDLICGSALASKTPEICDGKDNDGDGNVDNPVAPIVDAAPSRLHSCALTADGRAFCFGNNSYGRAGVQDMNRDISPSQIIGTMDKGTLPYRQIEAGDSHTCVTTFAGEAYCWGENRRGALGSPMYSTQMASPVPLPVDIDEPVVDIEPSIVADQTCAVGASGKLYCWGGASESSQPTVWSAPISFAEFENGKFWCGTNQKGELYCNETVPPSWHRIFPNDTVKDFTVGGHACAIRSSDGKAFCWGDNDYGSLGNGVDEKYNTYDQPQEVAVPAGVSFEQIDAGNNHTCGLTADGTAYCWGLTDSGQIGNGVDWDYDRWYIKPVKVKTSVKFAEIFAGERVNCAITDRGALYCWGLNNYGQAGTMTSSLNQAVPKGVDCFKPRN